jgi:predicted PurR-regulated permease PerM
MKDFAKTLGNWIRFAGFVLLIAVLYWAQEVIVPVALAILLTFVLAQPTMWLQRWIGRIPAVLVMVILSFSILGAAGWGLTRELSSLANELPSYRTNIRQKVADIRGAGTGSSVQKVQQTLTAIQTEIAESAPPPASVHAVPMPAYAGSSLGSLSVWIGAVVAPLATAGLVIVLVIFMLLERESLRDRLIRLFGYRHLAVITRAFDEAATRISKYLLMQSLVNVTFGTGIAIGLMLIGVPYALLWGTLAAVLRFIPYIGPLMAAAAPILAAIAALPGWFGVLEVVCLFVGLELITNLVLEPVLYAGAAGVSQVALLIAVAFWTWLWGPVGLLLATPLTVCLVVLGRNVPGLEFLATLLADRPALAPDVSYYQRLLARDQSEAAELIERYVKKEPSDTVYDALLLPALNYAERDRLDDQLTAEEERAVVEATRELLEDVARPADPDARPADPDAQQAEPPAVEMLPSPSHVLGYPANADADELALHMLSALVRDTGMIIDISPVRMMSSEVVNALRKGNYRVLCIADLPPSAPSKTRYLVKRLRASMPQLKIVVGRWAPPSLADENAHALLEAGADFVCATLLDTRERLHQLIQLSQATPESSHAPEMPQRRAAPA